MRLRFAWAGPLQLLAVLACGACGQEEHGTKWDIGDPPPPRSSTDECVISADCPDGLHCDLGECIQECNTEKVCQNGESCSARARCLSEGTPDEDPPPVTESLGTLTVSPEDVSLTEADTSFEIVLTATGDETVSYRVELSGAHLSVATARGEFEGELTLTVQVDPSRAASASASGGVRIVTSLGEVYVPAPINIGVSGRYAGRLSYKAGPIALGDVQFAVDVEESNGDVMVRVDPEASLLFPEGAFDITGTGTYSPTSGLAFTVQHAVEESFGGSRNTFRRALGRSVTFTLQKTDTGRLEGAFEEGVYGLFANTVTVEGTVLLARVPGANVEPIEISPAIDLPANAANVPDPMTLFNAEGDTSPWTASACAPFAALSLAALETTTASYYRLHDTLQNQDGLELLTLEDSCAEEVAAASTAAWGDLSPTCGFPPMMACALLELMSYSASDPDAAEQFNVSVARLLSPGLLAAHGKLVESLTDSFALAGVTAQRARLDEARELLARPVAFALQPELLERLGQLPVSSLRGDPKPSEADSVDDPTRVDYPAVRALARLFELQATLDADDARLSAAESPEDQALRLEVAQERALLGYFEVVTIAGLLEEWGSVPSSIGNQFIGMLTELDAGYQSLRQGPSVFGAPPGFIPFVYDPARAGAAPTNFEQYQQQFASVFSQQSKDEADFLSVTRQIEQNLSELTQEQENVASQFDLRIQALCGDGFDVNAAGFSDTGCNGGQAGELALDIELAREQEKAALGRMEGIKTKIGIEEGRLAQVMDISGRKLQFIHNATAERSALNLAEGVLNTVKASLDMSSEGNIGNLFLPGALAPVATGIEIQRTLVNDARIRLEGAEQSFFESANMEEKEVDSAAQIESMFVDLNQLALEAAQYELGIQQARLRLANAVSEAKRLWEQKQRVEARLEQLTLGDQQYRVLQEEAALDAVWSRLTAYRHMFLLGRALEYEINTPISDDDGATLSSIVMSATNANELEELQTCYTQLFGQYREVYGNPQPFSTDISVRELLGVTGSREDEVTGKLISAGEQFRNLLLRSENFDGTGAVGVEFTTNLDPGNGLWSASVCDDKLTSVQVQLVGDFLGDSEAEVKLELSGVGLVRRCYSDELVSWQLDESVARPANIQAGVNDYGLENNNLFGNPVARSTWKLTIPAGAQAPANDDLDLTKLEDIVIRVQHQARGRLSSVPLISVSSGCLGRIGGG